MIVSAIETVHVAASNPPFIFVQVHTDEGVVGLGQTADVRTTAAVHDLAARYLLGRDPLQIESLWTAMFEYSAYHGYGGSELRAISAIDIALWDILGQVARMPIYQLLGGASRDRVRIYNTCSTYRDRADGKMAQEEPARLVEELLANGITCVKTQPWDRIGGGQRRQGLSPAQLREGVAFFEALDRSAEGQMEMMIDLHSSWGLSNVIAISNALESAGLPIYWIEDPVWQEQPEAWAEIRQRTSIRIAGSERLLTRHQMRPLLEAGGTDVMIGDITWTGGISELKKMATMADAFGVPLAPHDHSGPVNLWASAHVLLNVPNASLMETTRVFYETYYDEMVEGEPILRDGHMHLPQGPGLGIRLRPEVMQRDDTVVTRTTVEDIPAREPWRGMH
jgi:L-alanine-DL-glutamate epimerase-like enolase superfamily enzyme